MLGVLTDDIISVVRSVEPVAASDHAGEVKAPVQLLFRRKYFGSVQTGGEILCWEEGTNL